MTAYTNYINSLSNEGDVSNTYLRFYSNYYTVIKFIYYFDTVGTLYRELSSGFWQPLISDVYLLNTSTSGWTSQSSHNYINTPYSQDIWTWTGLSSSSTSFHWRNDDQGMNPSHSYISADVNLLDNSKRIGINLSAIETPTINVIFNIDEGLIETQPNGHWYSKYDYGLEDDPENDDPPPDPPPPPPDPPDPPPLEDDEFEVYLMDTSDDGLKLSDMPITEEGAESKGWTLNDGKVYVIF